METATLPTDVESLQREVRQLRADLALRPSSLGLVYKIREALGLGRYFPLDHLPGVVQERIATAKRQALPADGPALEAFLDNVLNQFGAAGIATALANVCRDRANRLTGTDQWHLDAVVRLRNEGRILSEAAECIEGGKDRLHRPNDAPPRRTATFYVSVTPPPEGWWPHRFDGPDIDENRTRAWAKAEEWAKEPGITQIKVCAYDGMGNSLSDELGFITPGHAPVKRSESHARG